MKRTSVIQWVSGVLGGLLVLALVVFGVARAALQHTLNENFSHILATHQTSSRAQVATYLALEERLQRVPALAEFLAPGPRTHDAATLLNPRLSWGEAPPRVPGLETTLSLQGALAGGDFLAREAKVDLSGVNTSILRELLAYDTWNLIDASPRADTGPSTVDAAPHLGHLSVFAKARLIEGLRAGDPAPAAREVHYLALLLYRTETGMGAEVAVRVLRLERSLFDRWAELGHPAPEGWVPLTHVELTSSGAWSRARALTGWRHLSPLRMSSRLCSPSSPASDVVSPSPRWRAWGGTSSIRLPRSSGTAWRPTSARSPRPASATSRWPGGGFRPTSSLAWRR